MPKKMSWFSFAQVAARALLQFRETRRKIIFYTIVALLVVFALGNWPLASWLEETPGRFFFYWAGCAFLSIFLFMFLFMLLMRRLFILLLMRLLLLSCIFLLSSGSNSSISSMGGG